MSKKSSKKSSSKSKKSPQTRPDVEHGTAAPMRTPPRRTSPRHEISPADTFETALTSPSRSFDSSPRYSTPPPQKITIDLKQREARGTASRSAGLIFGMTKPFLGMALLFLVVSGGAGYLLKDWLRIPGLKRQVKALQEQVNRLSGEIERLSGEVNRLEDENDRYESLNEDLNQTVSVIANLTGNLDMTVLDLTDVAVDLATTNLELEQQIEDLTEENENYAELNQALNTTANMLATEIELFAQELLLLAQENEALAGLSDSLESLTENLGDLTVEQGETLTVLQDTLNGFTNENDRLQEHNDNLVLLIDFLNETSLGLDDSLQQVTEFLSEQITANKQLVLNNLEISYKQRLNSWDCDYRDNFRETAFGQNFDLRITDLSRVLEYVDERILSELCLDEDDFEDYLDSLYPDGVITTYRLMRAVNLYTTDAIDFYFPEPGETGLSIEDWSDASYDCENLSVTWTS